MSDASTTPFTGDPALAAPRDQAIRDAARLVASSIVVAAKPSTEHLAPAFIALELAKSFAQSGSTADNCAERALRATELLLAGMEARRWVAPDPATVEPPPPPPAPPPPATA